MIAVVWGPWEFVKAMTWLRTSCDLTRNQLCFHSKSYSYFKMTVSKLLRFHQQPWLKRLNCNKSVTLIVLAPPTVSAVEVSSIVYMRSCHGPSPSWTDVWHLSYFSYSVNVQAAVKTRHGPHTPSPAVVTNSHSVVTALASKLQWSLFQTSYRTAVLRPPAPHFENHWQTQ